MLAKYKNASSVDWPLFCQSAIINIFKTAPVPQHVAFILDGNRHYARQHSLPIKEGHFAGVKNFSKTLETCYQAGIYEISGYLFSIENFKRGPEQVKDLMIVIGTFIATISQPGGLVHRYQARLRVVGNLALLPSEVQDMAKDAMEATASYSRSALNLCVSYTSTDEITSCIRASVEEMLEATDSEASSLLGMDNDLADTAYKTTMGCNILDQNMMLAGSKPLDLLIRTSGTKRLSDFMLWQCHQETEIVFLDCWWPEFTFCRLMVVLFGWQWNVIILWLADCLRLLC